MPRVIHFEIEADDPQRAIDFYRSVFEWTFEKWLGGEMEYWLVMTGDRETPGIDGGLAKRSTPLSGTGYRAFVCNIDVPSIDDYISRIEKAGGKIIQPKYQIAKVGWNAMAEDTEGNTFGIIEFDKSTGM